MPLPRPETTPPVTKICLLAIFPISPLKIVSVVMQYKKGVHPESGYYRLGMDAFVLTFYILYASAKGMSIPKEAKPLGKIFSKKLKTGVDICQIRAIAKHLAEVNSQSEREYADVAELADALDSGSSGSDTVGVQVPSSAPKSRMLLHSGFFCFALHGFCAFWQVL